MPRSSKTEAARNRVRIAERVADLGSTDGLEGVSLGRVADELGLSKSGVVGPFGSKQELQRAAVEAALRRFRTEVWEGVADEAPGLTRLRALMGAWLSYLERDVFRGGCFLTAAALEFDDRPGPVRDLVAASWRRWLALIEHDVALAQSAGELGSDPSPAQIAFQLNGYVMAANWARQLYRDPAAIASSRAAIDRLLGVRPATA